MSDTNLLSNDSNSASLLNINEISSEHHAEYEQMAHQIQQQLFIDSNHDYQQQVPEGRPDVLLQNLDKSNTDINPYDTYYDWDEEAYTESLSDIDCEHNRTCDDIENILLDQIEFEHDIAVFNSIHENQAGN